jgi:hypothetical protein
MATHIMVAEFYQTSSEKQNGVSKLEATIFYYIILKVTTCHFCSTLLDCKTRQVKLNVDLATFKEKGLHKGMNSIREGSSEAISEAACHTSNFQTLPTPSHSLGFVYSLPDYNRMFWLVRKGTKGYNQENSNHWLVPSHMLTVKSHQKEKKFQEQLNQYSSTLFTDEEVKSPGCCN